MGCGGSKVDDLPLVTLCRERRDLIKAAADHRFDLASAHVSYFRSLKNVGDALRRFVDEELVIGVASLPGSPVLTLPSDEGKKKKNSSSSTSISHSVSLSHHRSPEEENSHLHLSSGSDSSLGSSSGHIHIQDSPEVTAASSSPPTNWSRARPNSYSYYMRRSSTEVPSMVYEEPQMSSATAQWADSSYSNSGYPQYGNGGFFGMGLPGRDPYYNRRQSPPPSPPSPPQVSAWDFLNPFDSIENVYHTYYSQGRYGIGSNTSSPDSNEVREKEGIPDLEDETEQEPLRKSRKEKKTEKANRRDAGEGTSRAAPLKNDEGTQLAQEKEIKNSPDTIVSKSTEEEYARKKGVSFEVDEASIQDGESSNPSSLTTLSSHGMRDLHEVIKEVRDEFVTASDYGKEVSVMLEVGKLPYPPRGTMLKVISSRILDLIAPSMLTSSHRPFRWLTRSASRTMKMSKANFRDPKKDVSMKSGNLSLTLEKLYVWEKKLYKEVKDEEKLRVNYEKKCKRLKILDDRGAESNKIDATQASIQKLLTKISVAIGAVESISRRIHKLRDEELEPQLTELIHGLIRMWKSMLKCHQKQFQAIMERKGLILIGNTGVRGDSSLRATVELEMELLNWCTRFNDWINTQKAYVESLNEWLLRCLLQEREETIDGVAPFSPSRVGAPPVFIICNDWYNVMERISETRVANTMHAFALSLHQLWQRQDEQQRQRLKAEYLSKDFEKLLRSLRKEESRMQRDQDASSDKTAVSVVPTESGVSPLDDLKVDLDSMREKLHEERAKHKETVKQVHEAASRSLQAGLIPIFEDLCNFTSETLKAYEQVRIQNGRST
ncbi:hypothetical protein HHK36_007784 [Tetracentron sinense]|uniref:DUF632 domain-containing protein n=1 Tax=Tetracentron sinense TaxID=13715 RepID=A0A835DMM2_TETSI|nr:hypothetical protein HHK36_007784 [Tetracentron sinense]